MYNILVVDDTQGWRMLLVEILTDNKDYNVIEVGSFVDAIRQIKDENIKIDLAIFDKRLVHESPHNVQGLELLRIAESNRPKMKKIILTGYPDDDHENLAINQYKADLYLEKVPDGNSFDIDDFLGKIERLLGSI